MRKIFFYLFLIELIPVTAYAQDATDKTKNRIDYAYTFGINTGINYNINGYRINPNSSGNNFYGSNIQYNIGVDYGMMITKKFRPRFELKYVKMNYYAGWENTDLPLMQESVVNLYNFDIIFHMDYLLLNSGKFQFFVSPALKWELNIGREENNLRSDGKDNWKNYNGIISENSRNLLGSSLSTIFKYNITKNIGITATPEYTLFFRNFVRSNDKCYQRSSLNVGVEFNFY
jgi:hypothetical protein